MLAKTRKVSRRQAVSSSLIGAVAVAVAVVPGAWLPAGFETGALAADEVGLFFLDMVAARFFSRTKEIRIRWVGNSFWEKRSKEKTSV